MCVLAMVHVEVREHLEGVGSLLFGEDQGTNSGCQAWREAVSPALFILFYFILR